MNCDIGISPNSIEGLNLYQYAFNNPITSSDDDGEWPKWATKIAIGVGVIAVCAVVTVATGGATTGVAGYIA